MLGEGASEMLYGTHFLEYLDGLALLLKEILILYGEGLPPELLVLLLLLVHLRLLQQLLPAVLIAAEGPVEPWLHQMAEHMRFQPLLDVAVVGGSKIFGQLLDALR